MSKSTLSNKKRAALQQLARDMRQCPDMPLEQLEAAFRAICKGPVYTSLRYKRARFGYKLRDV